MALPHRDSSCSFYLLFYRTLFFCSTHFFFLFSLLPVESAILGNETDRLALLAFKQQIIADPSGALASWNDTLHFCEWKGVTCSRRHGQRVTVLNLANEGLVGPTSPLVANLSFLSKIDLGNNNFNGPIPQGILLLPRLQDLNLSCNSYQGEIPANLTTQLRSISLFQNQLRGVIPRDLSSLSRLTWLDLGNNKLGGGIPPSLANLSSLATLIIGRNSLIGAIPHDLGRLAKLKKLVLISNALSGTIPLPLYNLSSIVVFSVPDNQLQGRLPPDLALSLPSLQEFDVGLNQLEGAIPTSFPNASRIIFLGFGYNDFTGSVPMNLGNLRSLNYLSLSTNKLGSRSNSNDMNFLTSLVNCSDLEILRLGHNHFRGSLPNAIANLSTQLTYLTMGQNHIEGTIPVGIENLVVLIKLTFEINSLTGTIPFGIGMLSQLQILWSHTNYLSGAIPTSIGNLTRLSTLDLSSNNLTGNIPLSIDNCRDIQGLYLDSNKLSGIIPAQIFNLPSLSKYLNLSNNSFSGNLPSDVGKLQNLQTLDISYNNLSGEIPSSLSNCLGLEYLRMEYNNFRGKIPPSLSTLKGMRELYLSFNNLEGEVPQEGIFRNVSAISLEGNNNLCGGVSELHLPACHGWVYKKHGMTLRVKFAVISVVLCVVLTSLLVIALHWRKKSRKKTPATFFDEQLLKVSYAELHRATNGFSLENLIGTGGYGAVYKGTLQINEKIVAVKVINLEQHGASESFKAECEALRNSRHRNLVKIITSCSSIDFNGNDFKALVFEYMPNGSLEKWLHQDEGEQHPLRKLTFVERVNIAIDIASALNYLHHQGPVPIVHRDLKPSNILFDDDMNAHVGDFGLAKLLSEAADNYSKDKTSSLGIKGSIGYAAPEYGMGCKASRQGDVYSYGILLMEIFTGKRPTDSMFKDGLDLYQFIAMSLPDQVMEIVDPHLLLEVEATHNSNNSEDSNNMRARMHDCLIFVFKIAISCCIESPRKRIEMGEVIIEMIAIKNLYLGTRVYQQR